MALPVPTKSTEIDASLSLLDCIVPSRSATYFAVPITTGVRFVDWYSDRGSRIVQDSMLYSRKHRESVVLPNCREAKTFIQEYRQTHSDVVIEPTSFEYPGWTQSDYRFFWGQVIERHVAKAIFLPGWQFSNGCCFEFLTAYRQRVDVYTTAMERLEIQAGIEAIEESVCRMKDTKVDVSFMVEVVSQLKELQSERTPAS